MTGQRQAIARGSVLPPAAAAAAPEASATRLRPISTPTPGPAPSLSAGGLLWSPRRESMRACLKTTWRTEQRAGGWILPWALTTTVSRSGARAWTDSPGGNYQNDQNTALWSPVIDLTGFTSATLTFWHQFDFGSGDSGNVWVARQREDGAWWTDEHLRLFTGTQTTWQQTSLDLTPFVGEPIRLAFPTMVRCHRYRGRLVY